MATSRRKKKVKKELMTEFLRVRLTPSDMDLIEQAAENAHLSVSAWVKSRLVPLAEEELDEE